MFRLILVLRETNFILDNNIRLLKAALFNDIFYLKKQTPVTLIQACRKYIKSLDLFDSDTPLGILEVAMIENVNIEIINTMMIDDMGTHLPTFSIIYYITIPDFHNLYKSLLQF